MSVRKKIHYPRKQYRAWWWDYRFSKAYFVTINCSKRLPFFGSIAGETFFPSEIGQLTEKEWIKTPQTRPDMRLTLGPYVIMPDHFHGIVHIGHNQYNQSDQKEVSAVAPHCNAVLQDADVAPQDAHVAPHCNAALQNPFLFQKAPVRSFGPQSKNLSAIIRGFKGTVTLNARMIDPAFAWQPRFYDRIIRNEKEYDALAWYIQNNVKNYDRHL
jgi:REP element-mobilizing transposase RayT